MGGRWKCDKDMYVFELVDPPPFMREGKAKNGDCFRH